MICLKCSQQTNMCSICGQPIQNLVPPMMPGSGFNRGTGEKMKPCPSCQRPIPGWFEICPRCYRMKEQEASINNNPEIQSIETNKEG